MATPRKPRRKTTTPGPSDEFRDQLANLHHAKSAAERDDEKDRPLTPREEYRAALDELNRYSTDNETAEALAARERFDRADRKRRWWRR
ncbi:hypothetical protein [Kribbella sp. NPDC050470]|uniref:hypothetical protein n=1 Tax=unclassified Kribbella TaxID=2644121 RepID=UPI00379C4D97